MAASISDDAVSAVEAVVISVPASARLLALMPLMSRSLPPWAESFMKRASPKSSLVTKPLPLLSPPVRMSLPPLAEPDISDASPTS